MRNRDRIAARLWHCHCWRSRRVWQIDSLEQLPQPGQFQRQPDLRWHVGQPNFHATAAQIPAVLDERAHGQRAQERQLGQVQDDQRIRLQRDPEQLGGEELGCDFQPERDTEILRSLTTLERINEKPAADFWKEVDGR